MSGTASLGAVPSITVVASGEFLAIFDGGWSASARLSTTGHHRNGRPASPRVGGQSAPSTSWRSIGVMATISG